MCGEDEESESFRCNTKHFSLIVHRVCMVTGLVGLTVDLGRNLFLIFVEVVHMEIDLKYQYSN